MPKNKRTKQRKIIKPDKTPDDHSKQKKAAQQARVSDIDEDDSWPLG